MQAFTLLIVLALQTTAGSGPVTVGGAPGSPAGAVKDHKEADPNAVVCHDDASGGHLIRSKTCHTRAEWDRIEVAAKASADRASRTQGR